MAVPLFTGNVIAVIWDFDQTLIPGYQQKPLFAEYGIDASVFWKEVDALVEHYRDQGIEVSADTTYLNHILTYVQAGLFTGLSNAKLRELGAKLEFHPGMPEFMRTTRDFVEQRPEFARDDITVEHYVVSTGLRQMIRGSQIDAHVDGIWACEFIEEPAAPGFVEQRQRSLPVSEPVITQVGYFLDNTTKTRAVWEINKGTNVDSGVGVNDLIASEDRRVPLRNMLYVADGPSDIPVFSILNSNGGRTLGVYNPADERHFREVKRLRDQGRVQHFAEADYRPHSAAARWILATLEEMAEAIVIDRSRAVAERVMPGARHLSATAPADDQRPTTEPAPGERGRA